MATSEKKWKSAVDDLLTELDGMLGELRVEAGSSHASHSHHHSRQVQEPPQQDEKQHRPNAFMEAQECHSCRPGGMTTAGNPSLNPTSNRHFHPSSADIYHHNQHFAECDPSPVSAMDVYKTYSEPRIFASPVDKTLASITALPDAYAGWIQKASYSLLNTRSLKNRYIVLANCTLYLFYSDVNPHMNEYYDAYVITPCTIIHVKERGMYCLELHVNSAGDTIMFDKIPKVIEIQCHEKDDMIVWLDCFKEVIEEAKLGRCPLPFRNPHVRKLCHKRSSSAELAKEALYSNDYADHRHFKIPPQHRPSLDYGELALTKTKTDELVGRERKTQSEGKKMAVNPLASFNTSHSPKLSKLEKEILKEERKLEKLRMKKVEQMNHMKKLAALAASEMSQDRSHTSKKYKTTEEQMQFFLAAGSAAGYF